MIKITEKYRRQVRKIDVIHVKQYLERIGWSTIYFNTPSGDKLLAKLKLEDIAAKTDGFVYKIGGLQYVFINASLCEQDKLITIIHESAHIFLGHDFTNITKKDEAEAWHFTYRVLHRKSKVVRIIIPLFVCLALFGAAAVTAATVGMADEEDDYVYVTPSGLKYHTADCRYVIGKRCIKLHKDEASLKYSPCSVCNYR